VHFQYSFERDGIVRHAKAQIHPVFDCVDNCLPLLWMKQFNCLGGNVKDAGGRYSGVGGRDQRPEVLLLRCYFRSNSSPPTAEQRHASQRLNAQPAAAPFNGKEDESEEGEHPRSLSPYSFLVLVVAVAGGSLLMPALLLIGQLVRSYVPNGPEE